MWLRGIAALIFMTGFSFSFAADIVIKLKSKVVLHDPQIYLSDIVVDKDQLILLPDKIKTHPIAVLRLERSQVHWISLNQVSNWIKIRIGNTAHVYGEKLIRVELVEPKMTASSSNQVNNLDTMIKDYLREYVSELSLNCQYKFKDNSKIDNLDSALKNLTGAVAERMRFSQFVPNQRDPIGQADCDVRGFKLVVETTCEIQRLAKVSSECVHIRKKKLNEQGEAWLREVEHHWPDFRSKYYVKKNALLAIDHLERPPVVSKGQRKSINVCNDGRTICVSRPILAMQDGFAGSSMFVQDLATKQLLRVHIREDAELEFLN